MRWKKRQAAQGIFPYVRIAVPGIFLHRAAPSQQLLQGKPFSRAGDVAALSTIFHGLRTKGWLFFPLRKAGICKLLLTHIQPSPPRQLMKSDGDASRHGWASCFPLRHTMPVFSFQSSGAHGIILV